MIRPAGARNGRDDTRREAGSPRVPAGRAAVAGLVAAMLALAVSSLVGGLVPAVPSLVVSVGNRVIDNAPAQVEQWAIATLGTADKPALVAGIIVLSGVVGAVLGVAASRRFVIGVAGFWAFGAFGVWAATVDAAAWAAVLTATVSALAGTAALWWLLRRAAVPGAVGWDRQGAPVDERPGGASEAQPIGTRGTRRAFLQAAGATAATAVVTAAAGRYLFETRHVAASRADLRLPPAARPAADPPPDVAFDVDGLDPWVTPNGEFYRIDTALRVPRIDAATWQMSVTGMVDNPFTLTYDDLLSMGLEEHYVTLACVSNEVGGELVDNARWRGVPLPRLLERAGVQEAATQVVGRSVDGFTVGFPTEAALDGRTALVAIGMNGEPLPAEHGFPARLVVAGLFGYVSATKWLSEIELTTLDAFDAYWIPRGWAKFGPIVTQSRIDVPRRGATVDAGVVPVAGVAYAPTRGISRVEVRVDDGPWQEAELAAGYNDDTWRQWAFRWHAEPGTRTLTVRATDGTAEVQIAEASPVAPDGATGYHRIHVSVA